MAHRIAEYVEIDGPVQAPLIEAAVRAAVAEAEPLNVRFGADAGAAGAACAGPACCAAGALWVVGAGAVGVSDAPGL